jgi:hypothetical protein
LILEKLISMQKEALSIGGSIEISNKLNDLDSRLNQPVDTATIFRLILLTFFPFYFKI